MTGREWLQDAATSVFATGSFWMAAVPMAAALASLELLVAEDGITRMRERGEQLVTGLAEHAAGCVARGVFLHPRHNWFMSTALTERDIAEALRATDAAFAEVAASIRVT